MDVDKQVVRNLIYAQVSFFLCLGLDVIITTKVFKNNRGLSFYGEHLYTAIPFALGFILCDLFLLKAASLLNEGGETFEGFIWPLRILALLLILIVLTPDTLNGLFNVLHIMDSSLLFLFELLFSIWLVARWHSSWLTWLLLVGQFLAGVMCGLSEFQFSRYLSEGTLVYQLFFSFILILVMSSVVSLNSAENPLKSHKQLAKL
jgi:hypothetical protein